VPNYVQNTYGLYPKKGVAGARATKAQVENIQTQVPRNSVYPGRFAFRVPGYGGAGSNMLDVGEIYQVPSPAAVTADVDAIVTAYTTSAALQTFSGSGLNGVVGATKMYPARKFTGTLSNHADWNATNLTLVAKRNGVTYTEVIAIPDAGNATITSVAEYDEIVSISIPAQGGTGGTATFGIAALTAAASILKEVAGVVMYVPMHEQASDGTGLVYADGEPVDVMDEGEIWVEAEEAMIFTDTVYVRVGSGAGGSLLGKVRNDADSGSCIEHTGARVVEYESATGLVHLKLKPR
jgi:hypothetical protein